MLRNASLVGAVQELANEQLVTASECRTTRSLMAASRPTRCLYVLLASNAVSSTHSAPLFVSTAAVGGSGGDASIQTSISNVRQTTADVQWSLTYLQYTGPLDHYALSLRSLDASDMRALCFGAELLVQNWPLSSPIYFTTCQWPRSARADHRVS